MYKKLSEEKLDSLINAGIDEFAAYGFEGASIGRIAKKAGVSVGVVYKYYADKDALFIECVRHSLGTLNKVLEDVSASETDLQGTVRSIIKTLISHAKEYGNINRMYNEITSIGASKHVEFLADEIEGISSKVYGELFAKAQQEGKIRSDANPRMMAFFFDNLLMTLQFSYSCDYYRERMKLFCGEEAYDNDEFVTDELVKFMLGAFGCNE